MDQRCIYVSSVLFTCVYMHVSMYVCMYVCMYATAVKPLWFFGVSSPAAGLNSDL